MSFNHGNRLQLHVAFLFILSLVIMVVVVDNWKKKHKIEMDIHYVKLLYIYYCLQMSNDVVWLMNAF